MSAVIALLVTCEDQADTPDGATISGIRPNTSSPETSTHLTIQTRGYFPVAYRNLSCGETAIDLDSTVRAFIVANGKSVDVDNEQKVDRVSFATQEVWVSLDEFKGEVDVEYTVILSLPSGEDIRETLILWPSEKSDSESLENDTDSDSDQTKTLRIQAECAFGANQGDCNGVVEGDYLDMVSAFGLGRVPRCNNANCQVVVHLMPGTWLMYEQIDFNGYNSLTLKVASNQPSGKITFLLDDPLAGTEIASIDPYNSSLTVFHTVSSDLVEVTGVHNLYVTGSFGVAPLASGNLDWLELSTRTFAELNEDLLECQLEEDCYNGCWECAIGGYCAMQEDTCLYNPECQAIYDCLDNRCNRRQNSVSWDCYGDCFDRHPKGRDDFVALRRCVMCDACPKSCFNDFNCFDDENFRSTFGAPEY
ncbi:MAG: carbohydrate-binding protein [Deltaproteobacteria bacterium]|nr:carbohydrate-binding protein [Deltaproteobacteria bacterium]